VEDSSRPISNDSEATTPVATHAVEETGVCSNSGLGSSIIITVNKSEGAPYLVTSSVAGNSICAQGGNGDTNVTTPVAGTEREVRTGQWASSSYENAVISVCEETSGMENRSTESCCHEQRKLPEGQSCCLGQRKLPDRQSCWHEQRKLPCVENLNDCCAARSGSISSKDGMLLLGPAVSVEKQDDCCATRSSLISSEDGMLSLGPAVSVNVEREVCELPVKSTAETGYEVDQSDCQRPSSPVAVFLSPHPALASSSKARQDTDELPFHQQEITLNDTTSIVQHDSTDCKQFEGIVEQDLSEPRNEMNYDDVCDEGVENVTGVNDAVSLYSNPVQTGPSQGEIQSVEVSRRPARVAARPSRFRDDQFETQFRPGLKDKVRQVHFNPGKGESLAVEKSSPKRSERLKNGRGIRLSERESQMIRNWVIPNRLDQQTVS